MSGPLHATAVSGAPTTRQGLRILHVTAPARVGGLERVVAALAKGQVSRGHHVVAVLLLDEGAPQPTLLTELENANVRVLAMTFPPRSYRRQLRTLARCIREEQPDVVHSHGYLPDVMVALLRLSLSMHIVTTVHGFTGGSRKNRAYEWLQVRAYRYFDAVVAVSASIRQRLLGSGVPKHRLETLRNAWRTDTPPIDAIDARRELHVSHGTIALGWIGRVSHEKGLDVLVDALAHLSDLPVRLVVIGDGRERGQITEHARAIGVSDRIDWAGFVPHAGRLLRAFDIFVLSSRTEGTPITLLEAMDAGVPIVAAAVGGVPDVVTSSEAVLVQPEDPVELAAAIRDVVTRPAAAATRATRATERLHRDFAPEPWLDAYDAVYRKVRLSTRHDVQ